MPTLYTLTTECVTEVLQREVERRGLLADNQMGTVRRVQGAKEQALLNIAVNKHHGNHLKAMWVDVKKAFDSVDHSYLRECLSRLCLPAWIETFLGKIVKRWTLKIYVDGEHILDKKVKRGILQGDSLSPLLFALCIDPLSRALNAKFPKVPVPATLDREHVVNHLLFVDDLKLLAHSDKILVSMAEEVKSFFGSM